jgi:hypothetical protein
MLEHSTSKKIKTRQALVAYKSKLMDNLIREKKFPANIEKFWLKLKENLVELVRLLKEKLAN